MGSKKKKYNSRFPPARIKKIMQVDEEIGKVAQSVPVIISKCVEMFLTEILKNAGKVTTERKAKTMTIAHLKELVMKEESYDFLRDLVQNNELAPFDSGDAPKQKRKRSASSNKCKSTSAKKVKVERKLKKENDGECVTDDIKDQASTSNQQKFEDPFPTSNMQQPPHYFPPSLQQPLLNIAPPPPPISSMDDEDDDYDM